MERITISFSQSKVQKTLCIQAAFVYYRLSIYESVHAELKIKKSCSVNSAIFIIQYIQGMLNSTPSLDAKVVFIIT